MPLPAMFAAASKVTGLLSAAKGLLPANKKDPLRIANAQSNLEKALAGDMAALAELKRAAAGGSATEVGREANRRALAAYNAQRTSFESPVAPPTPFQQQVSTTVAQVQEVIAQGVQNIGAGATTAVANRISGTPNAVTIPLNRNQLILLAVIAGAIIWLRK